MKKTIKLNRNPMNPMCSWLNEEIEADWMARKIAQFDKFQNATPCWQVSNA